MQILDFKMNEKHPCSKPLCVGYKLFLLLESDSPQAEMLNIIFQSDLKIWMFSSQTVQIEPPNAPAAKQPQWLLLLAFHWINRFDDDYSARVNLGLFDKYLDLL